MNIFRNSLIVILGTLGIKFASLLKDVIISKQFGLNYELTLYLSCFLIPSILANNLGICFQVFATPQINSNHKQLNKNLFKKTFIYQILFSLLFYLILFFTIDFVFPNTRDPQSHLYAVLALTVPYFLFMPLRTLLGQVLYLNDLHIVNFLFAFISPLTMIVYIGSLTDANSLSLGISLSASAILEFLLVFFYLHKKKLVSTSHDLDPINVKPILQIFILQLLISSNLLIDQIFANRSGNEFLAAFNYASKIPNIIASISMVLTTSIFLPAIQQTSLSKVKVYKKKIAIGVFTILFMTIAAYFLSFELTQFIYQNGNFGQNATLLVSDIQASYFLMAPLSALFLVFIRFLNAKNLNSLAMKYASINFIAIFVTNYVLFKNELSHLIPFSVISGYLLISISHIIKSARRQLLSFDAT